jgi:DnaJ-class molecular chaperone
MPICKCCQGKGLIEMVILDDHFQPIDRGTEPCQVCGGRGFVLHEQSDDADPFGPPQNAN